MEDPSFWRKPKYDMFVARSKDAFVLFARTLCRCGLVFVVPISYSPQWEMGLARAEQYRQAGVVCHNEKKCQNIIVPLKRELTDPAFGNHSYPFSTWKSSIQRIRMLLHYDVLGWSYTCSGFVNSSSYWFWEENWNSLAKSHESWILCF